MQAVAEKTHCECCGATLGIASLHRANTEWAKRVAALQRVRPTTRFRLVRHLWAICVACGTEYDYDARARIFHHAARSDVPDSDQGKVSASPAIPDLDDRVWLPAARPITDFVCDVSFRVEGKLTTLRDADADGRRERVLLAEVAPPGLPQRLPNGIVTADIAGHTKELIAYYQRLIAAAAEVGLTERLQHPFPYFRVKPVIMADTELTEFAWYDSVAEATTVLRAIATYPLDAHDPQEILDDLEQGWRGRLAVWHGRIGLVEWNWEQAALPPTPGYSFDGAQLASQAGAALRRLEDIHRELVQALGQDYWNHR
jgi:hypothetical protein